MTRYRESKIKELIEAQTQPQVNDTHSPMDVGIVGVSSAISICAAVRRAWRFALQIFAARFAAANAVTFGAALSACDKGSQWQLGLVTWRETAE